MSTNLHIAIKNIKGTCVRMYAVLHGIAQIPLGKAQNRAQSEVKFAYRDEEQQRYLCVDVFCFAWDSSNSGGEGSKSSSK